MECIAFTTLILFVVALVVYFYLGTKINSKNLLEKAFEETVLTILAGIIGAFGFKIFTDGLDGYLEIIILVFIAVMVAVMVAKKSKKYNYLKKQEKEEQDTNFRTIIQEELAKLTNQDNNSK